MNSDIEKSNKRFTIDLDNNDTECEEKIKIRYGNEIEKFQSQFNNKKERDEFIRQIIKLSDKEPEKNNKKRIRTIEDNEAEIGKRIKVKYSDGFERIKKQCQNQK